MIGQRVDYSIDNCLHRRLKAYAAENDMRPTEALAHAIAQLPVNAEIEVPDDLGDAVGDEPLKYLRVTSDTRSTIRAFARRQKIKDEDVIDYVIARILIDEEVRKNGATSGDGRLLGPEDVSADMFFGTGVNSQGVPPIFLRRPPLTRASSSALSLCLSVEDGLASVRQRRNC